MKVKYINIVKIVECLNIVASGIKYDGTEPSKNPVSWNIYRNSKVVTKALEKAKEEITDGIDDIRVTNCIKDEKTGAIVRDSNKDYQFTDENHKKTRNEINVFMKEYEDKIFNIDFHILKDSAASGKVLKNVDYEAVEQLVEFGLYPSSYLITELEEGVTLTENITEEVRTETH